MLDHARTRRFALAAIAITSAGLLIAGCGGSKQTSQANRRWANAVCTNMLAWQKQVHQDETSFNFGFGPRARLNDAIGATRHVVNEITVLGPPVTQRQSRDRPLTRGHPDGGDVRRPRRQRDWLLAAEQRLTPDAHTRREQRPRCRCDAIYAPTSRTASSDWNLSRQRPPK